VVPGAAGDRLATSLAMPDADDLSLQGVLPTKRAGVLRVLRHLHLLHRLPQRRSIAGGVFASNSDLLCAFRHLGKVLIRF